MILSKYLEKLPKINTKFIIGRRYDGCVSIYADMEEIEQKKIEAFGKAEPASIGFLVFNSYQLRLNSVEKKYELDEKRTISRVIDSMISSIKDFNRRNSGLRNHRMGGVHQFLKMLSSDTLYSAYINNSKSAIDLIDRITITYMLIGASATIEEIKDAINDMKNTHSKTIKDLNRGYYDR